MKLALPGTNEAALWQEVEFGSYGADLALWTELADEAGGPVMELGAGAGRISLDLARDGHEVVAVERDGELVEALERSAEMSQTSVQVVRADLTAPAEIQAPVRPLLAIGPLHVIQLIDPSARPALLHRLRDVIEPGGRLALTVVDEESMMSARPSSRRILPDMRELDGWVYSSEPLWIQVGRDTLTVRRVRESVSPEGVLNRSVHDETLYRLPAETLEGEGERAGLRPGARRRISYGEGEADSLVVVLEVPG